MNNKYNDLTFFTNTENNTLSDRFNKILSNNVEFFDVLVGYFRTSGFYNICDSMDNIKKTRILVGLNVDKKTVELINYAEEQMKFNFITEPEVENKYSKMIYEEIEKSEDKKEVEDGIKKFIRYINEGKLEIRVYPKQEIHAKVYIMRKDTSKSDDFGKVITGSSNFSKNGLESQLEFNVELKDSRDVNFALERFEQLWEDSVDISSKYIDTVNKTWIREDITPYELYLKCIYEYFKEEIDEDKQSDTLYSPSNFKELQYQKDAVIRAEKILHMYNGVFISDVVGLGKTYICAMLAQRLRGNNLIICPPVLKENWEDVLRAFKVPAKVESLGKLDYLLEKGIEEFDYVFIDEAHRFRNAETISYSKLYEICHGKKVVLISATPKNNSIKDIANLIYLFQYPKDSNIIPGVLDIKSFFDKLHNEIEKEKKIAKNTNNYDRYKEVSKKNSDIVRKEVLNKIMVRRTRKEIEKYYKEDLEKQGLKFPKLEAPKSLIYEFEENIDYAFNQTLSLIKEMNYSRYKPLRYLKSEFITQDKKGKEYNRLMSGQENMGGFMKGILLKRLESSFYAFQNSIDRFIVSSKEFIDMYNTGTICINRKDNIDDLKDSEDEEVLTSNFKFNSYDFKENFIIDLEKDLERLKKIKSLWNNINEDPKIRRFIEVLKTDEKIKNNKILVFTESKETAEYIYNKLEKEFKSQSILFTGDSNKSLKNKIEKNFNPDLTEKNDDYRILITTDVLSEGISLHRANVIINYDLPWNPTRIMQRAGRVNRVGSKFNEVYIYNFLPASKLDKEMNLNERVLSKIQAFHYILGEDFKYLSDEEDVDAYEIFSKITGQESIEYEDTEENLSLKYLQVIRNIRDNDEHFYKKIKDFPKKIKSSKVYKDKGTITFFRRGKEKRFFITNEGVTKELDFEDAFIIFETKEDTQNQKISKYYFDNLNKNKSTFFNIYTDTRNNEYLEKNKKGTAYDIELLKVMKQLRKCSEFKSHEISKIDKIIDLIEQGVLLKRLCKDILKEQKNMILPNDKYQIISKSIPRKYFSQNKNDNKNKNTHTINDIEIVVSLDLI